MVQDKFRHHYKANAAAGAGMTLFQIFETEWANRQDIIKSMVRNALGLSKNKVYARNCTIGYVSKSDYNKFMADNHLNKSKSASVMVGLYCDGVLVSAVGFSKHLKYEWEIARFASLLDTVVVGGFSKLLSYFVKTNNPNSIMAYADRRFSSANCYLKCGFVLDSITRRVVI